MSVWLTVIGVGEEGIEALPRALQAHDRARGADRRRRAAPRDGGASAGREEKLGLAA